MAKTSDLTTIDRPTFRVAKPAPVPGPDAAPPLAPDDFAALRRRLEAETGGQYRRFIAELTPRYGQVWRDIGAGYAALAVVLAVAALPLPAPLSAILVLSAAVLVGYGVAFLQLFIHEAAHANLAPDRRLNDRLANLFIAWHLGADIGSYRMTHLAHHRNHGAVTDTERSYFNALTPWFLLEMLSGIHAVRVFLTRSGGGDGPAHSLAPLARGMLVHFAFLALLIGLGAWRSAVAWVLGVGIFLPFFSTLRQLLEHRSPDASALVDYAHTPHGAYTRIFRGGLIAETFGGAGFNRHLLHHWEPQISYTRLPDFEAFVRRTSAHTFIEDRTTTYGQTLRRLWRR
jgi:fatty acid desaturase